MQGNTQIIAILNRLLTGELTAVDQYFLHAEMYRDWGLGRLFERVNHEMEDEREHSRELIKRILFLEGSPDVASRAPLNIGTDVPSMLKNDLELEYSVVQSLREAIAVCEQVRDFVTREILVKMLEDTEVDHAYWLEQQLGLIKLMGLDNYIQSQTGGLSAM